MTRSALGVSRGRDVAAEEGKQLRRAVSIPMNAVRPWLGAGLAALALVSVLGVSVARVAFGPVDDRAPAAAQRAWPEQLRLIDAAIARGDISAAARAFRALGAGEAADACGHLAETLAVPR
jgi:hypothetical protein